MMPQVWPNTALGCNHQSIEVRFGEVRKGEVRNGEVRIN